MSRLILFLSAFVATCAAYEIVPLANYIQTKTYNLELDLEKGGNFSGLVTIKFSTTNDTPRENKILLNSEELDIVTVHLQDKNGKEESITNYSLDDMTRTVTLQLEQPLEQNSTYELKISYNGRIWSDRGMYKSRGYTMTNLNPIYARRILPCFDNLDKKAMFTVVVISSDPYVISNMPIESKSTQTNGKTRYTFKRTPKIPINRLFILSGPQEFVHYTNMRWGNATLYLYPGYENFKIFNDILSIANTTLLHKLWAKSGLEKLDILVVHDLSESYFAGYGVVLLRKDLMEFDPVESTTEMKREAAFTILQAILEVYFGSIVSPMQWQSNWLSASVAQYLKYLSFNKDENWGDIDEFKLLDVNLKTLKTMPAVTYQDNFNETDELLDFLSGPSFTKGASLFSMMETFLTTEELSDVLVTFMDKFKYGDGITEMDLFSSLTALVKNLPVGADKFLQNWVYLGGVPLADVTRVNGNTINIRQLTDGANFWILPVAYTMKSRTNYDPEHPGPLWLLNESANIAETVQADDWVAVNTDGNVPFNTNYDQKSWYLLGQALRENVSILTPSTRAKLVDDAFKMAKDKRTSYTTVLHFLTYLDNEEALAPWALAINGFKEMYQWIYFTPGNSSAIPNLINLKPEFENYVVSRMIKIYKKLGFEQTSINREQDSLRREIVSAMCYFGYEPCKTSTLELFKKMNRTAEPYTPPNDMRSVIYCTGMSTIDKVSQWNTQYDILYKPELGSNIIDVHLQVLACPDPVNGDTSHSIRQYLTLVLKSEVTNFAINKIETAYNAIRSRANHINQALYFLLENMSGISKIGADQKAKLLGGFSSILWTDYHNEMLGKFLKENPTASDKVTKMVKALQLMLRNNQRVIQDNMEAIHVGLTTKPDPVDPTPTPPTTKGTTSSTGSTGTGGGNDTVTPTATPAPTTAAPSSEGLSTGSISLIVVGVIVGIVLIGVILYFSCRNGGCCE